MESKIGEIAISLIYIKSIKANPGILVRTLNINEYIT
jgi:hypothetical protein